MTSPFHIQQPRSQGHYLSRSVDTKASYGASYGASYLGVEGASFDSVLSASSKDVVIAGKWVVLGRIGEGSFGEVFEVEDIDTFKHYAIKREPTHIRNPQIPHETDMYDALVGGPGIPQCHWHGKHDGFDCIIIDLLGPNLQQIKEVTHKFSIEIVVELGSQMVSILEHIHKRGLVYRDVKPDNFLFSSKHYLPDDEESCEQIFMKWKDPHPKLYVVDFGLTTWWRHPVTNKPFPELKKMIKNKTGTARYASLNVHRGKMHSRRDDIESLGYLMIDLLFGTLPWTGIQARNARIGWDIMKQIKEETKMTDLCAGLPEGFSLFIEYARRLKFMDEPDYNLLREFLTGSIHHGKYSTKVNGERKWVQEYTRNQAKPHSRPKPSHEVPMYSTHMISPPPPPPPPRQRRASYNPPSNRFQYSVIEDTGVFAMDDLMNNLPQDASRLSLSYTPPPKGNPPKVGRGSFNNNHSLHKRSSRDFAQKTTPKNRRRKQRVGWNSHKHEGAPPRKPAEWDGNAPDHHRHSWEDNIALNGEWSIKEENTWSSAMNKP